MTDTLSANLQKIYNELEETLLTYHGTTQATNKRVQKKLIELDKAKRALATSSTLNIGSPGILYPDIRQPDFGVALSKHPMITQYAPILKSEDIAKDLYAEYQPDPHSTGSKATNFNLSDGIWKHSGVQKMLRNFLSPLTPYRGLLIIHGTGVGKTCTAITIAESLKQYELDHNTKIYVILPDEFKRQIFEKGPVMSGNPQMQCTGETYLDEISENPRHKEAIIGCQKGRPEDCKQMEHEVKKVIKKYYDFSTDYLWAKKVNSIIRAKTKNIEDPTEKHRKTVEIIRKMFNNSVLIVDEAHNLRNIGRSGGPVASSAPTSADGDSMKASGGDAMDDGLDGLDADSEETGGVMIGNIINKVLMYSQNMRLILLSATPMYDKPQDIVPLLNYLLLNDKRPKIAEKDVFDKDGNIKNMERLIEASRGYVSYVRGNDPVNFPLRLTAEVNLPDSKMLDPKKYPAIDVSGNQPVKQQVNHLKLVNCPMSEDQQGVLVKLIGSSQPIAPIDSAVPGAEADKSGSVQEEVEISESDLSVAYASELQASNYVYKSLSEADNVTEQCYGVAGFNSITEKLPGQLTYKLKDPEYAKRFTGDGLREHGPKLWECLENIKKSQGPVFVYTYYTRGGVFPMAFALEMAGYTRYGGEKPLLDSKYKPSGPSKGEYIVYIGNKLFSKGATKYLDLRQGMINEKNVKVVLASKKGSEGLNLFGFREIHLLDPWHNINLLEQTIGRVIRNRSHHHLPPEQRNVCVYMYATAFTGELKDRESVDLHVYALCENKAVKAGAVEMALKENAIDCTMNKAINYRSKTDYAKPVDIVTSQGKIVKYNFWDKPYSRDTLYMPTSEYKCIAEQGTGDGMLRPISKQKLVLSSRVLSKELRMYKMEISEIIAIIKKTIKRTFNMLSSDIYSIINEVLHIDKGASTPTMANNIYQYILNYIEHSDILLLDKYGRESKIVTIDSPTAGIVLRLIPLTNYNKSQGIAEQETVFVTAMDKLTKKKPQVKHHAGSFGFGSSPTQFEHVDQVHVYPLIQKLRKDKVKLLDKEELNYKSILIKLNNEMSSVLYKNTVSDYEGFETNLELSSNYGLLELYKILFDRLIFIEKLFVLQYLCLKVKIGDTLSGFEKNLFTVINYSLVSKTELFGAGTYNPNANYLSYRDDLYGFIIARFNKLVLYKLSDSGLPEPGTISDSKVREYYMEDKAKLSTLILKRVLLLEANGINNLFGYLIYSQNETLPPVFKITDFISKGKKKSVKGVTCTSKQYDEIVQYIKQVEPKYNELLGNMSKSKKLVCGDLELLFRLAHTKSNGRPAFLLDPEQYYIWSAGSK